ncbi:DUF2283 domain-containing protein [Aquabacter sp. CN5-332]|uniref:DUF2283 domain-containing protein n=1 Tax=Aquabacter sp. CN5-332 TaxID=3156608 RepID=UPI0032B436F8
MADMTYDPEADAVYIYVGKGEIAQSAETASDVVLDYDSQGRIIGIEVLNASSRLAPGAWRNARRPNPRSIDAAE